MEFWGRTVTTRLGIAGRLLIHSLLVLGPASAGAFAGESQTELHELQVKSAFLYNFAKFVDWPPDPGGAPITFCTFVGDPLSDVLRQSLTGKTINNRPLLTRQIPAPKDAQNCQVVFVSGYSKKQLVTAISSMPRDGTLTIGDSDQFAVSGGMIQLIKGSNKFRFAINVDAVNRNGLRISSKLLQLAEVIRESGEPGKNP
jgi:hypothetical protein